MTDQLLFNGINGETGEYLIPPVKPATMAAAITGAPRDREEERALRNWWERYISPDARRNHGAVEGTDYKDLASSGWGVIFPYNVDPQIREALQPLLNWRREQAGDLFKECTGGDGYVYKPSAGFYESKLDFLRKHKAGPGAAEPEKVPYYLLLVGTPEQIPYRFQSQLDVQYAVGRIHFDDIADYSNYANSVVKAEKNKPALAKEAAFFGVANPGDPATSMSLEQLVSPLAAEIAERQKDWKFNKVLKEEATKTNLARLFGDQPPSLLFTASHGMGFPNGHPLQRSDQGAILCQDWPGIRQWRRPIPKDFYLAADDIENHANVFGLIAFFFACYGAGTPKMDEFAKQAFKTPTEIAPESFVAKLPQRLLGHPQGGALAIIGHVERAWGYSFSWDNAGAQRAVFITVLKRLMDGYPIGYAFEQFNERYAELSTDLTTTLEDIDAGKRVDPIELTGLWTANNDARNYIILGDPAVRLMTK